MGSVDAVVGQSNNDNDGRLCSSGTFAGREMKSSIKLMSRQVPSDNKHTRKDRYTHRVPSRLWIHTDSVWTVDRFGPTYKG